MNENPFLLKIQLKQHTPLIHFQSEQVGATLRATEVKPKLDRFIFHKFKVLFPNDTTLYPYLKCFDCSEKEPSKYKIRICHEGNMPKKYLIASYLKQDYQNLLKENEIEYLHSMPYFAQESEISALFNEVGGYQGERRKEYEFVPQKLNDISKWGIMHHPDGKLDDSPLYLKIISFEKPIIEILEKVLPYFFAYENFGTRQSKGFGCFSVVQKDIKYEELLKKVYPTIRYKLVRELRGLQRQLEQIGGDYKLLKSGRGSKERGGYAKSQMFLYGVAQPNPIRWEKRKFKRYVNDNKPYSKIGLKVESGNSSIYDENGNQSFKDPNPAYDYKYIRALLGLAEQYELQTDRGWSYKYIVQVKSQNGIERFQSPIIFKIHDNHIYLLGEAINPNILGKDFEFKLKMKKNNKIDENFDRSMFTISTPTTFDLAMFLHFALVTGSEKIKGYTKL